MIEYSQATTEQIRITEEYGGREVTHDFVRQTGSTEKGTNLQPDIASELLTEEQAKLDAYKAAAARYALKPRLGQAVIKSKIAGVAAGTVTSYLVTESEPFNNYAAVAAASATAAAAVYGVIGELYPRSMNAQLRQERRRLQDRVNILKRHVIQLPLPAKELEPVQE